MSIIDKIDEALEEGGVIVKQTYKKDWSHRVTELQQALRKTRRNIIPLRDILVKAGLDYEGDVLFKRIAGFINDAEKNINKELARVFRGRLAHIKHEKELD